MIYGTCNVISHVECFVLWHSYFPKYVCCSAQFVWLFSVVPSFRAFPVWCSNIFRMIQDDSENKFQKLVHLLGFTVRNLTRCTVIWKSDLHEAVNRVHHNSDSFSGCIILRLMIYMYILFCRECAYTLTSIQWRTIGVVHTFIAWTATTVNLVCK